MSDHRHDWRLTEGGYVRSWDTELDETSGTIVAYSNGTEDWSDEGDGKVYLECLGCMATKPIPSDWEIDYQ